MRRMPVLPLLRRWWLFLFVAAVITFLIVPIGRDAGVDYSDSKYLQFPPVAYSLRWYENFWHSPDWLAAARASLTAAVLTVISRNSGRCRRRLWHQFLSTGDGTPCTAHSAPADAGAKHSDRHWHLLHLHPSAEIVNSMAGIVIAHSVLALPFVVLMMLAAFRNFDFRQEQAAISLGASPFSAFIRVTLPQLKASVISAALFAFITSLDEVIVGLCVAGGENTVLTRRMFLALRDQVDPTVAAISTILILISVTLLCALALLQRHPHR